MRHRRVHRDHQVHVLDQRRGVVEIRQLVTEQPDGRPLLQEWTIGIADLLLQTDEFEGSVGEVDELLQRDGTMPVAAMIGVARPRQPHPRPVARTQPGAPVRHTLRIGVKILGLCRDGIEIDVECQRQAQQRAMIVGGRHSVAVPQDRRRRLPTRPLAFPAGVGPQHDLRPLRGDQFCEAAELDAIAQPLLAPQQDGLAIQRLLAEPGWGIEFHPVRLQCRNPPAPFVFRPAGLEIADQQPAECRIDMHLCVIGIDRQDAVIALQRFPSVA